MEKFGLFTILNAINSFLEVQNSQDASNKTSQSENNDNGFSSEGKNTNSEQNAYYEKSQGEQKQNAPNFDAKTATLNKNLYPDYSKEKNTATQNTNDGKTDGLRFAESVILKHESMSNKLSNKDK